MIVWIVKRLEAAFARMTHARALRWGGRLGFLMGSVLRLRRREVLQTLARCFPDRDPDAIQQIADGMYRNFGMLFVEVLRFGAIDRNRIRELIELDGENTIPQALEQGRGALVLTAQLGNFELLCNAAPLLGVPLTVITKTIKPDSLNQYWEQARHRIGVKTLPARNSYRACRQVLKNNEVLGFVLDQNMKRKHGIFVDFFGRPACTSPGLAFLSARSQAPVIPIFIIRQPDGRHLVKFFPTLAPPADCEPETIRAATQQYTSVIEDVIRAHPEQWTWMHRRWRTQPE